MRRVAITSLAALGTLAAVPLAAQAQRFETVIGAGSYNEAPLLEPGRYSDTIRGAETNVYAISIPPGQFLSAEVALHKRPIDGTTAAVSLDAIIDSPGRVPVAGENDSLLFATPGTTVSGRLEGPLAQAPEEALLEDDYPAAGVWYLRLSVDDPNGEVGSVEFPLDFELALNGTPTGEAEPPIAAQETEVAEPPETDDSDSEGEDESEDDGGSDAGLLAGVGLAGVAAGGFAGFFVSRRREEGKGDE